MLHDPSDHRMTINESMVPVTFPGRSFLSARSAIQGANMAFRREVLDTIGGFDPLFGPGSRVGGAEDLDAAGRASAAGWKGEYRPEIVVRHHHRRKAADAPSMMRTWGKAIGAYHMKLLLEGGEVLWFIRSIFQIRQRFKRSGRMVLGGTAGHGEVCPCLAFAVPLERPTWITSRQRWAAQQSYCVREQKLLRAADGALAWAAARIRFHF